MIPRPGDVVLFQLASHNIAAIDALRAEHGGAGNTHRVGDVVPLVIVRVWGDTPSSAFNGKALLDAPFPDLWVSSTCIGPGPAQCAWLAPRQ